MKMAFLLLVSVLVMSGTMLFANEGSLGSVVVMLGPPGSGKGTQAVRLSEKLAIPHVSTGDLFRENMKNDTPVGRKAKEFINQGKLVPDEITMQMLAEKVVGPEYSRGYILDGVPRTAEQVRMLDELLQPTGQKIAAIYLEVSDEEVIKRISGRRSCPQCGTVYHVAFSPSKIEGKCDKDQTPLIQREDDKSEVVSKRLQVYHAQTAPVVDLYRSRGILKTINGEQKPGPIFDQLMAFMDDGRKMDH